MPAIDTVYTFATNPGAGPAATAPAAGDNLTVRNFNAATDQATLEQLIRRGATAGFARVRSPRLHDVATGINWNTSETVDTLTLPNQLAQPLYPADNLITEISGGAAESDALVMLIHYTNLPGVSGQFMSPGDLQGNVRNVKAFQVAAPAGANAWTDTVITTTENLLHADADYAVLGYKASTTCAAVAVKAPETGNLRVGGPGTTTGLDTADWFIRWSRDSGYPAIPVFNANNRFGVFVSCVDVAAVAGEIVTLICAELTNRFTSPS